MFNKTRTASLKTQNTWSVVDSVDPGPNTRRSEDETSVSVVGVGIRDLKHVGRCAAELLHGLLTMKIKFCKIAPN